MSDSYSANVILLLHMEGDNNSTSFIDNSPVTKTVVPNGNVKISTTQSKWANGSGYFDGSGDYLSLAKNIVFGLEQLDFTVEAWIYPVAITNDSGIIDFRETFSSGNGTFFIDYSAGKKLAFWDGSTKHGASGAVIQTNQWTHVALSKNGTTLRFFVNGTLDATSTISISLGTARPLGIGGSAASVDLGGSPFNGYMQDIRITKGVGRYTSSFTLPTARLSNPDPVTYRGILSGYRHDIYDGGRYRISGTVTELGIPGQYRVRLFDRLSGRLVRETWSAADGAYQFDDLAYRAQGYITIAHDHGANPHNAAIADLITPEPMP